MTSWTMTLTVVMTTAPKTPASLDFCSQVKSASALSITFFLRGVFFRRWSVASPVAKRYLSQALHRTVGRTSEKVINVLPTRLP